MNETKRRRNLPYRLLIVALLGAVLALMLAAYSVSAPLSSRTVLLLLAGALFLLAVAVEVVFRDIARLRSEIRKPR